MDNKIDYKQRYDEFTKAIYESKGRANNQTIYNLISDYNCTAEDLRKVAKRTEDTKQLDSLGRFRGNEYAVKRLMHECLYSKKIDRRSPKLRTFRDYKWYFRYMPDEYLDDYYIEPKVFNTLVNLDKKDVGDVYTDIFTLYTRNQIYELVNGVKYPSETLLSGLMADNEKLKDLFEPYRWSEVTFNYNQTDFGVSGYRSEALGVSNLVNFHYRNKDKTQPGTYTPPYTEGKTMCKLLDSVAQIAVMTAIMDTERKETDGDDGKHFNPYTDYLFNTRRKTGVARNNPEKARLELFGQVRSMEMLLDMGLGLYYEDSRSYRGAMNGNKKLVKRIQTAYKTFVKSKTVEDRQKMRNLLKRQLEVLINDFMGRCLYVRELKCIDAQDKAFEKSTGVKTVKAGGATVGQTLDLSKLAKATTKTVEKARY